MGVRGLWRLLLPIGRRVSIETLEGKILAIDASIWLTQFIKAMRDPETGSVRPSAHLLGFLRRICKLLYHGIRPVFVFDGPTPEIKKREVRARKERREKFGSLGASLGMEQEGGGGDDAVKRMAKRLLVARLRKRKELEAAAAGEDKEKDHDNKSDAREKTTTEQKNGGKSDEISFNNKKKSKSVLSRRGAFAAGFNPGNDDDDDQDESDEDDENDNCQEGGSLEDEGSRQRSNSSLSKSETKTDGGKKHSTASASSSFHRLNGESIAVDVEESWDYQQNESTEEINDWDKPAPQKKRRRQEQQDNDDDQSQHSSPSSPYSPTSDEDESDTQFWGLTFNTNTELDLETLTSLPPNLRRDAIERAQKHHRIQSRKQYMPVAAQPTQYSQMQLQNFLRGSRLNKTIQEVGQRAAMSDVPSKDGGSVVGERIASDATKRFIFIKDVDKKKEQEKILEHNRKKGGEWNKSRKKKEEWKGKYGHSETLNVSSTMVNSDEENDENDRNGLDATTGAAHEEHGVKRLHRLRRKAQWGLDNSVESDDDEDIFQSDWNNNGRTNGTRRKRVIDDTDSVLDEFDGGNSDEDGGGFFVRDAEDRNVTERNDNTLIIRQRSEDSMVMEIDDSSADEGGGGFLTSTYSAPNHRKSFSNERTSPHRESYSVDGSVDRDKRQTQIIEDEMLARAIHDAENNDEACGDDSDGDGEFITSNYEESDERKLDEKFNLSFAKLPANRKFVNEQTHMKPKSSNSGSRQDVDEALAAQLQAEKDGMAVQDRRVSKASVSAAIDLTEVEEETDREPSTIAEARLGKSPVEVRNEKEPGSDCSGEVDWEDGEIDNQNEETEEKNDGSHSFDEHAIIRQEPEDKSESEEDVDWEDGDDGSASHVVPMTISAEDISENAATPILAKTDATLSLEEETSRVSGEGNVRSVTAEATADTRKLPNSLVNEELFPASMFEPAENSAGPCDSTDTSHCSEKQKTKSDDEETEADLLDQESVEDQYDSTAGDGGNNDFDRPSKDDTAAVFHRAQQTASNLTNWAGRAVRRAIAEHIGTSGPGMVFPSEKRGGSDSASKNDRSDAESDDASSSSIEEDRRREKKAHESRDGRDTNPRTSLLVRQNEKENNKTESIGEPIISGVKDDGVGHRALAPMDILDTSLDALREKDDVMTEEARREQRDMDTVTDEMKEDVVQLLQAFGIPYIEAPAEAEAQCVTLEDLCLVDGIVTEDSDVFVFGGKNVYKNIFDDQKYVEVYLAKDAERELALAKNQMVALAMLLGGDYTDGVKGVGIVNGMEILQAFDVTKDVREGLTTFRKWLDGFDPSDAINTKASSSNSDGQELSEETLFHNKHKSARTRWAAPKDFPAQNVLNAYLKPVVDKSKGRFSWGVPDLDIIRSICYRKIGWEEAETDRIVVPAIKKVESGSRQTRIESYFMKYEDNIKFADVRSKRLRNVFNSIKDASGRKNERANSANMQSSFNIERDSGGPGNSDLDQGRQQQNTEKKEHEARQENSKKIPCVKKIAQRSKKRNTKKR